MMCDQPADVTADKKHLTGELKVEQDQRILKRVVFVRHGEGFHNVAYATGGDGHRIFDPKLTLQGISEARALFTGNLSSFKPEVAFVSPLWRTLETCVQAFAARDDGHECPVDAVEDLREHNHVSLCNHRRPISEDHKIAFPGVCFASLDVDGPPPAGRPPPALQPPPPTPTAFWQPTTTSPRGALGSPTWLARL